MQVPEQESKHDKKMQNNAMELGMLHAKHIMKEDSDFNDGVTLHGAGFWNHFVKGLKKGIETSAKMALPVMGATQPELAPIAIAGELGMEALKGSGSRTVVWDSDYELFEWAK